MKEHEGGIYMRNNPCKECVSPKRYPGCHVVCEAYIKWKEEWDELKAKERKQKQMDDWARPERSKRRRR